MNIELHSKISAKAGVNYYFHVEHQGGLELATYVDYSFGLDITKRDITREQWHEWYHQMRKSRREHEEALDKQMLDEEFEYMADQDNRPDPYGRWPEGSYERWYDDNYGPETTGWCPHRGMIW